MISYTEMTPGISLDIIAYISSCLRLTEAMEHYISVMPNYLKKKNTSIQNEVSQISSQEKLQFLKMKK